MTSWMQEYWYLCLIALIIGIVTAWWIWARVAADGAAPAVKAAPAAPLQPVRPEIVPAEPARFVAAESEVQSVPPPDPAPTADTGPRIVAAVGAPDNLMLLKGVGPKLNQLLASIGVLRFDQIAAWTAADIAEVDGHLGTFKGRITRDNWVDQAGYLARGDKAGFEAKYGALGSEL
jgi:predicted flap endonuclease-1-like 5' DNA nuclease